VLAQDCQTQLKTQLTSIDVLIDRALHLTRVHRTDRLTLQRLPVLTGLEHAFVVHGLLQRVVFPAKEVISMCTIALVVIVRQEERVGAVLGPHVVELRGIPERLVCDLWHADGMGSRAGFGISEGFVLRVVHVVLMVGGVDVFAVPAAGLDGFSMHSR
jgi:hypothetical protein